MDKQGIALYKLAVLRKKYQRSLLLRVITYMSPKYLKRVGKIKKTYFFPQNRDSDMSGKEVGRKKAVLKVFQACKSAFRDSDERS